MMDKTVAAPITWFGSKSRLVKKIVSYFPKHTTFVDVFGGSGAVLLGKRPSKVEVYNDINKKLVSLFKVFSDKNKTYKLIKRLEFTPYSAVWERIDIETIAYSSRSYEKYNRSECLWISPNCQQIDSQVINKYITGITNRQTHAYNVHKSRIANTKKLIRSAINSLQKIGQRVTKSEVSRITDISRVQISRRYQHLFE